jgi:dTDP-4-dehydrorhamnose 3,5-epimerase
MIFTETPLRGAFVLDIEPIHDDRGFFAYLFCAEQAARHGLRTDVAQVKLSTNKRKGTLRGMHYQVPPAAEAKLVRCVRGVIWDVILDLREGSETYLRHFGVELSAENRRAIYVPPMFAHGYQTLSDDADVVYQVDAFYAPQHERGLRYDDPRLAIRWPLPVSVVSAKDASWPLLEAAAGAPARVPSASKISK